MKRQGIMFPAWRMLLCVAVQTKHLFSHLRVAIGTRPLEKV